MRKKLPKAVQIERDRCAELAKERAIYWGDRAEQAKASACNDGDRIVSECSEKQREFQLLALRILKPVVRDELRGQ